MQAECYDEDCSQSEASEAIENIQVKFYKKINPKILSLLHSSGSTVAVRVKCSTFARQRARKNVSTRKIRQI